MILQEIKLRVIENKDWATLLFVLCLSFVVLARIMFENRFNDFIRLLVSDKYLKIYRESNHLISVFNVFLLFVNLVTISFLIILFLDHYHYGNKTDWRLFIQIFILLSVFIFSKFLIEKIIGTIFNIDETIDQFNLQKVNYRTYVSLLILPLVMILYYNNFSTNSLFIWIFGILLIINCITYLISLKNYQKLIFGKIFYFILYLCTFEIAPYYFIFYLITKN